MPAPINKNCPELEQYQLIDASIRALSVSQVNATSSDGRCAPYCLTSLYCEWLCSIVDSDNAGCIPRLFFGQKSVLGNRQSSILNPQSSILNPQYSILNTQYSIGNPQARVKLGTDLSYGHLTTILKPESRINAWRQPCRAPDASAGIRSAARAGTRLTMKGGKSMTTTLTPEKHASETLTPETVARLKPWRMSIPSDPIPPEPIPTDPPPIPGPLPDPPPEPPWNPDPHPINDPPPDLV